MTNIIDSTLDSQAIITKDVLNYLDDLRLWGVLPTMDAEKGKQLFLEQLELAEDDNQMAEIVCGWMLDLSKYQKLHSYR